MHRNNVGNRKHKEITLWHEPSIILKIIGKIMRISQPFSYDTSPEGKVRIES
jgi:hypothetical protein